MKVSTILAALFLTILSMSTISGPPISSSAQSLAECNAGAGGDYGWLLETAPESGFLPTLANANCISLLLQEFGGRAVPLAKGNGFYDLAYTHTGMTLAEEELYGIASRGDRYQIEGAKKAAEYLETLLGEMHAEDDRAKRIKATIAFFRANRPQREPELHPAKEDLRLNLLLAPMQRVNPTALRQFCETDDCAVRESEICTFRSTVSIKVMAFEAPDALAEKLSNCRQLDIRLVAILRAVGILDGMCSLSLQTQAFVRFQNFEEASCANAIMHIYEFGFTGDDFRIAANEVRSLPDSAIAGADSESVNSLRDFLISVQPELKELVER